MFFKNRMGMEALQMVILGLLITALGVAFITRFQVGIKNAGNSVNSAMNAAGGALQNSVANIQP